MLPSDVLDESAEVDECEGGPPRADLRGTAGLSVCPELNADACMFGANGGREGDTTDAE